MSYVLKLCSWYPSRVDAFNGDFVQRHARAIATKHKVVVLYARKDPGMKGTQPELHYRESEGVHEYIYYYPKRKIIDTVWSQWYFMAVLKQFLPVLLQEHGAPFIVHVSVLWKAARWALYLHRKFQWPYVITEHSTEYLPDGADNFRRKEKLRQYITRKAFQKSNMLLPVSTELGRAMQQLFGPKETMVIPNVVDTKIFYPVSKSGSGSPFRLVHISTMGYQKNIEGIIRVIQKLAISELDFQVLMIGPADKAIQAALSCTLRLKQKVLFTGNIPYSEVAAHLRQANGFFLFSRYENLPCVILESLCCGVPVISTNVGGISTVVNETNGELIASEDEAGLYIALEKMIKREKIYDRATIAHTARQCFSYEEVAGQFVNAYERATGLLTSSFLKRKL